MVDDRFKIDRLLTLNAATGKKKVIALLPVDQLDSTALKAIYFPGEFKKNYTLCKESNMEKKCGKNIPEVIKQKQAGISRAHPG